MNDGTRNIPQPTKAENRTTTDRAIRKRLSTHQDAVVYIAALIKPGKIQDGDSEDSEDENDEDSEDSEDADGDDEESENEKDEDGEEDEDSEEDERSEDAEDEDDSEDSEDSENSEDEESEKDDDSEDSRASYIPPAAGSDEEGSEVSFSSSGSVEEDFSADGNDTILEELENLDISLVK